ncbi:hypothetical protein J4E91_009091 [Alternaria rosae]|nr:hypothetical protein J4E91_009091 [Alternaria rosae]
MGWRDEWPDGLNGEDLSKDVWNVQLLINEIEEKLQVKVTDIPTIDKGSDNDGLHLKIRDGPDLVVRLAHGDVNIPDFDVRARLPMGQCQEAKVARFKTRHGLNAPGQNAAPYTAEETTFLKKNYGSEYHFLIQHGLKIHNEEDREEGRAILRAIMREDEMSELEGSEDEEDDFDESQFESHQADYNFTERQLG